MSGNVMMFPDTVEEFMEQNKVVDREQVYSNGIEFVPIFRMQQWFDHVKNSRPDDLRPVGKWVDMGDFEQCSVCKGTHLKEFNSMYGKATWIKTPYCHNCGARMKGE